MRADIEGAVGLDELSQSGIDVDRLLVC